MLLGYFEDLFCFKNLSVISQLESRRYQISEIQVARLGFLAKNLTTQPHDLCTPVESCSLKSSFLRAFFCPSYGRNLSIFPMANHIFFSQFLSQNSQFQRLENILSNKSFRGIETRENALLMGM